MIVEEGRQWGSLVNLEAGLCRCSCMVILHATLGSRVQVDTIASQCMPIPPVVLLSRPNLLLPSSSSLAGGLRWYSGSRYHIDVDGELGGGVRIVGRKDRRRVRW